MRVLLLGLSVPLAACSSVGTQSHQHRFEFQRLCMGVQARVVIYAYADSHATRAAQAAFARLAELDQTMSDYRPTSELMRLCDRAGQGPVRVSDDLFHVLSTAGRVHDASNGVFDPSVGELTRLWRASRAHGRLPDSQALAEAREHTGWKHVRLDPPRQSIEVLSPVRLDLGGIAKGYASMEAVRTLRALGCPRSMVSLAGDIAAGDPPPGEGGWRVNVEPGIAGVAPATVMLRNQSVSTSGDQYQFLEVDGVRYSHILDPRTGVGITRQVAACVIADDGAVADASATALCVAPGFAPAFAQQFGIRAHVWQEPPH